MSQRAGLRYAVADVRDTLSHRITRVAPRSASSLGSFYPRQWDPMTPVQPVPAGEPPGDRAAPRRPPPARARDGTPRAGGSAAPGTRGSAPPARARFGPPERWHGGSGGTPSPLGARAGDPS